MDLNQAAFKIIIKEMRCEFSYQIAPSTLDIEYKKYICIRSLILVLLHF